MAVMETLDPDRAGGEAQTLAAKLSALVVGQDEAVQQIVDSFEVYSAGLCAPRRPIATLLFLGPTGSGKTRTVEALAQCLFGNERALLKIDCGEFQHSHEIAKLIGSPPGYLGHRETSAMLSQAMLERHQTRDPKMNLVLFDEIEKASDALWNLLLGIMDKATLTLGDNRRVDFSRSMIFMTSNLGAAEVDRLFSSRLGFSCPPAQSAATNREALRQKIRRSGMDAVQRHFTPEFINRFDRIVAFNPLGTPELSAIIDIELQLVQQRILESRTDRRFEFTVTDAARHFLLQEGTDRRYGARHIKRAIERLVVRPISKLMASGQIQAGDRLCIDHLSGAPSMTFGRLADTSPRPAGDLPSHAVGEKRGRVNGVPRQEVRPVFLSELGSVTFLSE